MDVSKPFTAISPSLDAAVLVELAGSTAPRSGRELARRVERSHTGVQHVLDRLVEHGLVNREEAGKTFLYKLNRDHLLAPTVEQMAGARAELVRRLRDALAAWRVQPVHASLFGSAARGDGDASSDIDLLVVRSVDVFPDDVQWRAQLDTLADLVRRWTGNNAGIAEVSENEIPRLRQERPPVVEQVSEDSVELAGIATRKLLGQL